MRPLTVHASISAPREEIFDRLADLAQRPAFSDHYLSDYRLARVDSTGTGAAARFRVRAPLSAPWAELVIAECDRPRRIVERVRLGRLGRSLASAVYDLSDDVKGVTRVELTIWTEPATRLDAVRDALGARRWLRRQAKLALERLRLMLEEPPPRPLVLATIAGYEPSKAARFGL